MFQKAVAKAAFPSALFSSLIVSFGVSAQTYYVTTGQTGAQTQVDVNHTSTWTLNVGSGYTVNFGGANLTMKDGSSTTSSLVLSLYAGSDTTATPLDTRTFTQSDFNALHGLPNSTTPTSSTSYDATILAFTSPYALTAGSYTIQLTSSSPDVQSEAYFIKGSDASTILTANGSAPPAGSISLGGSSTAPTSPPPSGGSSTPPPTSPPPSGGTSTPPAPTNVTSAPGPVSTETFNAGTSYLPTLDGGTLQGTSTTSTVPSNITLTSNGGTFDQNGVNTTYSGVISGPGPATFTNTGPSGGSTTLTGNNTYTGPTTVDPGATLVLSGSGSIANSSSVTVNGTLDISPASPSPVNITTLGGGGGVTLGSNTLNLTNANSTFGGVISGSGGVTISGGTQTFTGANTYTGMTTINPGATLALSGGGSVAGSVTNSGTLNLTGSTGGQQIGGNYTQSSSGTLVLQLSSPTATDPNGVATVSAPLNVNGDVTLAGTLNYQALLDSGQKYYAGERFTILQYGGTLSGTFANVTGPSIPGYRAVIDYSKPGSVSLVLLADLAPVNMPAFPGGSGSAQTASGALSQTGANTITASAANRAAVTSPAQNNTASLNTVGAMNSRGSSPSIYLSGFSIQQNFSQFGANSDQFLQSATNAITASARTAAALSAQAATGSVNSAAVSTTTGAAGQIVQSVNNQLAANTQTLTNTQSATATTGSAQVGASGVTGQTAESNLNVASLTTSAPANGRSVNSVGLNQSLGVTILNTTATSAASAEAAATGEAAAKNLVQSSQMRANVLTAQTDALALAGAQNATSVTSVTLGNSVTANAALGASRIDGTAQAAGLALNTVQSAGAISFGANNNAFQQSFDSQGSLNIANTDGATTLNSQSALSTSGKAAIAGLNGSTTQNSGLYLNAVSAGGTLSGSLSQSTTQLAVPKLINAANVTAGASAALTDFGQSQTQLLNDASGVGANALSLTQSVPAPQALSALNTQVASAAGLATLNHAQQTAALGVNRASLSELGGASSIQQSMAGSIQSRNSLAATGGVSAIQSSSQAALTFANVLK